MKIIGNKNALHTPEFHKKKQIEMRIRIFIISLVFIILIVVPIIILRNSHLIISNIELKGNVVTNSEELQTIIADDLAGNYFWVIPRSDALLYPKQKIIKDLMNKEPRLSMVELKLLNLKNLSVIVAERTPKALYCKDVTDTLNPAGCYFIDASGFIFSEAPSFSGGVYFVYSSDPVLDTPLRTQYFDTKKFNQLDVFIKSLGDIGLYPKIFILKNDEYHLILSNGGDIMWKATQDLEQVRSNLSSFIEDASFQQNKNNLNNIQYIDLRFGNKIFYKYR